MRKRLFAVFVVLALFTGACGGEAEEEPQSREIVTDTPIPLVAPSADLLTPATSNADTLTPDAISGVELEVSTPDAVVADPMPIVPLVTGSIPENLISFGIDESSSIPTNCSLSNARYDIPNLFVPMFGQYYTENLVASSWESKYAPWLEVVHWPLWKNDNQNSYDIFPSPSSTLPWKNFSVGKKQGNGAFFSAAFRYMQEMPAFPSEAKPSKRTLILLTDGIFQFESGDAADSAQKVLESINDINGQSGIPSISMHIVLLCPERMDSDDLDWWVARQASFSNWFHVYNSDAKESKGLMPNEKGLQELIVEIWNGALKDKFPGVWDGRSKGAYLFLGKDYIDLNTNESKSFTSCHTPEMQERCIAFQFAPNVNGFHGGIVSLQSTQEMESSPYLLNDKYAIENPILKGERQVLWDIRVSPYRDCAVDHNWTLNPDFGSNVRPSIIWWRSSSDLQFTMNVKSIPVIFLNNIEGANQIPPLLSVEIEEQREFVKLEDLSACYSVALNVNGKRSPSLRPLDDEVSWDLREEVIKAFPDILEINPFKSSSLVVESEIVGSQGEIATKYSVYNAVVGLQDKFVYMPSFLPEGYRPCANPDEPIVGIYDLSPGKYVCAMSFEYIGENYSLPNLAAVYRPSVFVLNKDNKACSLEIKISEGGNPAQNGFVINVMPGDVPATPKQENFKIQISESFFSNNPNCPDAKSSRLLFTWTSWTTHPSPQSWICNFSDGECEPVGE